jgi:predicted SnoaL-like aldol condensation-catalyzing enzyme
LKEVHAMSPIRMEKIEAALRVVIKFNDAFNQHDVAGMMQLMTADCIFENTAPAPDGTVYKGREAVTQFWERFFEESPQAHIDIEEIFGLGGHCIMRWRYSWGDGHVRGVDIFKVQDGLIAEKLSYVKG